MMFSINLYVCMYVHVCKCVHVCMHVCMFVCMHVCMCVYVCMYEYMSGWIFQKVLAEIVQKGPIFSQKGLISNHRNFSLFSPKSMRFPSKDCKSKDLSL